LIGAWVGAGLRDAWRGFLLAGRFLTRWPLPAPHLSASGPLAPQLARAALFYPLIGLLLGAGLAGLALLLSTAAAEPAAAVMLVFWVWSTGALHLDGVADCADAWVGGLGSRERTLAILKDPRTGAMGVVALVLVLLAKWAGLAVALRQGGGAWLLLWLPALARAQLLALALTTPYARADGLGAALAAHLPRVAGWLLVALSWAVASSLSIMAMGPPGLLAPLSAALVFWRWRASLQRRIGGYTGDGAGALVELTETAILVTAVLLAGSG
jgi:adenosylcobinamide-GDP ribazoletransferase